jgi:cob(I)alamin adenosyltransferase
MKEGYLQVYTGAGKGKTTAAFGTAMRSVLHGGRVFFAQFIKASGTAELLVPDHFSNSSTGNRTKTTGGSPKKGFRSAWP